ncbi:MAG TPA: hypothetical protein VD866_19040 [Urbifossiella sp.]|nr:hypothetical protein [Urbifossiella sp.]
MKHPSYVPFGFRPGTDRFRELLRDCTVEELRHKFRQLEKLTPRALRAEVGSALRVVEPIFGDDAFVSRCPATFDLGAFLDRGGKLVLEGGGQINSDTRRVIMCGVYTRVLEHVNRRRKPFQPIEAILDECTNAGLAGHREEKAAGETRKLGFTTKFITQFLNFPGGPDGFLQNCVRKETFRAADYDLARKLAAVIETGLPDSKKTVTRKNGDEEQDEKRAERLTWLAKDIMSLAPGWRYVTDGGGSRKEYVPMLENPWPDWPGLREAKLEEKLSWIRQRPEYRATAGPPSTPSSPPLPPPPDSSSGPDSSPVRRWERRGRRPTGGSSATGGSDGAESA